MWVWEIARNDARLMVLIMVGSEVEGDEDESRERGLSKLVVLLRDPVDQLDDAVVVQYYVGTKGPKTLFTSCTEIEYLKCEPDKPNTQNNVRAPHGDSLFMYAL